MWLHDLITCLKAMRDPSFQTQPNYEYLWEVWQCLTERERAEVRLALAK